MTGVQQYNYSLALDYGYIDVPVSIKHKTTKIKVENDYCVDPNLVFFIIFPNYHCSVHTSRK